MAFVHAISRTLISLVDGEMKIGPYCHSIMGSHQSRN